MPRPVSLFTGQWADLPLEELCRQARGFGYDGLELACWGDHMDVFQAAESLDYCERQKAILAEHGLQLRAISNHLPGQLTPLSTQAPLGRQGARRLTPQT